MSLSRFNYIGGFDNNPVISKGTGGDWDNGGIREIGNVFWDTLTSQFVFSYSGYAIGATLTNDVYVGIATSPDGITWTKTTHLTDPTEDPYILENGGTYYLYCEDKSDLPFRNIKLYTSNDLTNWNDAGDVLDKGGAGTWDSQDVSSPIVWIEGTTWYMLYEGRGATYGEIGLATSSDGLSWSKSLNNPVLSGINGSSHLKISWAISVVSDSINKLGDTYFLTFHGDTGSAWYSGVATSTNLIKWNDMFGTYVRKQAGDYADLMIYYNPIILDYMAMYSYGSSNGFARGFLLYPTYTAGTKEIRGLSHG